MGAASPACLSPQHSSTPLPGKSATSGVCVCVAESAGRDLADVHVCLLIAALVDIYITLRHAVV